MKEKIFKVTMLIRRTNKHHVEGIIEDIGGFMYKIEEDSGVSLK